MGERDWSELFALLFEEIADRLFCMEDLFSFRMVCRSCRHFIRFEKHYYQPLLSKGIPWLMLTQRETNVNDNDNDSDHEGEINEHHDDDSTRNFFSLSTNKSYSLYLPEACGRRCWGSRYGWLITLGIDLEIHLLNPITRAGLPLPPQSTFKPRDPFHWPPSELRRHFVSKAVLGLLPSSSSFYEDQFIVFMLYLCGRLAFARPGDNAWTAIKTPSFIDVTFFNGQNFWYP